MLLVCLNKLQFKYLVRETAPVIQTILITDGEIAPSCSAPGTYLFMEIMEVAVAVLDSPLVFSICHLNDINLKQTTRGHNLPEVKTPGIKAAPELRLCSNLSGKIKELRKRTKCFTLSMFADKEFAVVWSKDVKIQKGLRQYKYKKYKEKPSVKRER